MNTNELRSNDLIAEWSRVTELVAQIREMIEEMADAYADSATEDESCLGKAVAERVADLATRLKSVFADEESHGFIADLYQSAPQLSDGLGQLKDERIRLLSILDDVGYLAGRPLQSESTWKDIEHRFQQFTALVAHQEQSEDLLIERAALEDAGVID